MLKSLGIFTVIVLTLPGIQAQNNQTARDYYRKAAAHFRADHFEEALLDFNKAVELDPTNADALFYRIMTLSKLDPRSEPVRDWDRIIDVAPRYKLIYVIYLLRANYRAGRGQFDGSIEDINKALEFTPNDGNSYHLRSFCYLMKGNRNAAYEDYKKSMELKTTLQNPLLTRGYVLVLRRDFESALADYTSALAWKPDDAIAYVDRGTTYVLMGKIDLGLADIKKGMGIDRVSIIERSVEGFGCPFCVLNVYVERHPEDARVHEARGILRLLQQQETDAKVEFDRSIALAPALRPEIERVIQEVRRWN